MWAEGGMLQLHLLARPVAAFPPWRGGGARLTPGTLRTYLSIPRAQAVRIYLRCGCVRTTPWSVRQQHTSTRKPTYYCTYEQEGIPSYSAKRKRKATKDWRHALPEHRHVGCGSKRHPIEACLGGLAFPSDLSLG